MRFDLQGEDKSQAYRLLASVVVPRPIALVTTVGPDGTVNAAPYSFFNLLGSSPPVVALGIANRSVDTPKDTRANIERTGEFVVNLVGEALAEAMNVCGIDFPANVSELDAARLSTLPSAQVSCPRLAESPVHLECRLHSVVAIGDNRIVLGEVVGLHVPDEFLEGDPARPRVRTEALHLIGRMHGGGWYARTSDLFDLPRVPYEEWQKRQGHDK